MISISKGFDSVKKKHIDFYRSYTYDSPLVMSVAKAEELKTLGLILNKVIRYLTFNYQHHNDIFYKNEKELKILDVCCKYFSETGTFRTDFIIDQDNHIKIIEINAGQPLNAYFSSGFFREIAMKQAEIIGIHNIKDYYAAFFDYIGNYIGNANHIVVIHGKETPSEIKIYPEIFEKSGIKCHLIPVEELHLQLNIMENAWVIVELLFEEIYTLPLEIIESLMKSIPLNPLTTYLIAGDKRFFYLLNQSDFIDKVLDTNEKELLKKYILPTYIFGKNKDKWKDAFNHKDKYIIKHYGKGRSEDVYAGCLTTEKKWKKIFDSEKIEKMVMQPFIKQKQFSGKIGNEVRNDFITGTLLYFNKEFFGPGLYRTHTSAVTSGSGNFRKIASLIAKADEKIPEVHYL